MSVYDGLPDIFAETLGESVTYVGSAGEQTVPAIFATQAANEGFVGVGTAGNASTMSFRESDVPSLAEGHTVTRKGITYRIVQPINPDGRGMVVAALEYVSG